MKRIVDIGDVEIGLAALLELDPRLEPLSKLAGPLPLRLRAPGFTGLAEIIVSQQVSKTSAAAMFGRLVTLVDPLTANNILKLGEEPMIAAGLSRAKQSTLTLVAGAIEYGGMNLEALCQMPICEAQDTLTSIKGIGPWTAEVFLLFCAGHSDIFPAGDVALQHAVGVGLGLTQRPTDKEVRQLAEIWSPWRGIAARLFWAYYAYLRQDKDVIPV
jgi:DNA-3-methyladenine glycosylase II